MTNPVEAKLYTLRTTDRAGNSYFKECPTWANVESAVFWAVWAGKVPILHLFGTDHDCDWDGLTEQEREDFEELI